MSGEIKNEIIEIDTGDKPIKLNENKTPFIAFYADIPHKHVDEVIEDIKEWYENKKTYLIGLEYAEAREHYHFVIDFTEKEYNAYVKRVLKEKYHLSGRRSKKGHTGQFGKVSKIRNIDAMCSYTLKDLDYRTNFSKFRIDDLIAKSYPKPEESQKDFQEEMMKYVKERVQKDDWKKEQEYEYYGPKNNEMGPNQQIALYIIDYFRSKEKDLNANTIRRFTMRYLTYEAKLKSYDLYRILFPHGL